MAGFDESFSPTSKIIMYTAKTIAANARKNRFDLRHILSKAKILDEVYVTRHFAERMVERNVDPVDVMWCLVPMLEVLRNTTYTERIMLSSNRGVKIVGKIYCDSKYNLRRIALKTVLDSVGNNDYFDEIFIK